MPIVWSSGNLLDARVDALVNTVNTEGIMGKGIALQFKMRFPANYEAYRKACARGDVKLGQVFAFDNGAFSPRWILNFPTKGHWRSRSRMRDIEAGLVDLRRVVAELGIESLALPPLGCGNGGLDWADVKQVILRALDGLDVEAHVYAPDTLVCKWDKGDGPMKGKTDFVYGRGGKCTLSDRTAGEIQSVDFGKAFVNEDIA